MYSLQFDGLFRGMPSNHNKSSRSGFLCYGWIINRGNQIIGQGHGAYASGNNASSMLAEYLALIEGLEAMLDFGIGTHTVKIFGDAKSVIDQMSGCAGVNSNNIWPYYEQALNTANQFHDIFWVWMPRKYNKDADWLTRWAMRKLRSDQLGFQKTLKQIRPELDKTNNGKHRIIPIYNLRVYQSIS